MPYSCVLLACATLGKALALSGPWFPIRKTKEHSSLQYSEWDCVLRKYLLPGGKSHRHVSPFT